MYANVLSVACPAWGVRGDGMPDTAQCGEDEHASMVLHLPNPNPNPNPDPNPNPNPNPNPDPNPNPNPTPEPKPDPNPNQVLLPAGERVTAVESTREGEMCTWEPVGVRPSPPSLWAAISGAVLRGPLLACVLIGGKSTAIALALRRLLPVGWDRPLGP